MAAYSYANLFGTTGAGKQGSKAGISTLFGQQATSPDDDEEMMRKKQQTQQQAGAVPQPTFAEKQKMGQARPAPPAAQAAPATQQVPLLQRVKKQLGGVEVAIPGGPTWTKTAADRSLPAAAPSAAPAAAPEAAATGAGTMAPMKPPVTVPTTPAAPTAPAAPTGASLARTLQEQLTGMLQPGGYTDAEFERLKAAQEANLKAEYGAEQQRLNEELARRGLSASSIGGGRMGDLAGQQARALATMQTSLLGQQAELRQRARETGITAMSDLTRTMLTNEQAQAETRLKEQLGMSEIGGVMYKRGPDGQLVPMTDAENKQIETLAAREVARKYGIAEAEVTGLFGGKETLPARTQRQNLAIQLAQVLAGSDDPEVLKNIMPYIYEAFGIKPAADEDTGDEDTGDEDVPGDRTAKPRRTSTVGQTPGGTTNVPGGTTTRPGIPVGRETPEEEPVEPRGPKKPGLGRPAGVEAMPEEVVPMEEPVLQPAEEPAAPPPPAATPTPTPRTLEEELIEILGGDAAMPILLPAEEPVAAPAPRFLPEPKPTPEAAPTPAPEPVAAPEPEPKPGRTLVDDLIEILSGGAPPPILLPAEEPPAPPAPKATPEPQAAPESEPAPAPAPAPEPVAETPAPQPRRAETQEDTDRAEQDRMAQEAIEAARKAQEEAERQAAAEAEAERIRQAERLAAKTPAPEPVREPEPILLPAPEPIMVPEPAPLPAPMPAPAPMPEPVPLPPDAAPVIQQLAEALGLPMPMPTPAPEAPAPMPMSPSELEEALRQLLAMQQDYTVAPSYGAENYYAE